MDRRTDGENTVKKERGPSFGGQQSSFRILKKGDFVNDHTKPASQWPEKYWTLSSLSGLGVGGFPQDIFKCSNSLYDRDNKEVFGHLLLGTLSRNCMLGRFGFPELALQISILLEQERMIKETEDFQCDKHGNCRMETWYLF